MEEKTKEVAALLRVLANENRLAILCVLMQNPLTVGEIAERVSNISQSAISQHLSLLKAYNILDCEKVGQKITYCIHDHRIEKVLKVLKDQYC